MCVSSAVFVFLYTWLEKLCSCAWLEIRLAFVVFTVRNFLSDHSRVDVFEYGKEKRKES